MSLAVSAKDFLLRPFDERSLSATVAFSTFAHVVLLSASTLIAWFLPRSIEPFPSTRIEVISEVELQQRLKAYRPAAKTPSDESLRQTQEKEQKQEPQTKQLQQPADERAPAQERVTVLPPKADEGDTINDLLAGLEKDATSEEALLDESLDEVLADTATEPSFLTFESVLTPSELAAFRRHITPCWHPPVGAPALENLIVDLLLTINEQAYVVEAVVMDRARMARDPFFRSAAEAALRTLSEEACSPLKLPREKYAQWKKTILRFDPHSLFGK